MTATAHWDGHQYDPAGQLSLPERIVHAVEAAIQGAATDVHAYKHGDWAGGFVTDLATRGAATVIDVLAEELKNYVTCPEHTDVPCSTCGRLLHDIEHLRVLAQAVRDVPAVEAV